MRRNWLSPRFISYTSTVRRVAIGGPQVDQSDQSQLGKQERHLECVAATYGEHLEADAAKALAIENHAPVKHERGLLHCIVHRGPIDVAEFFPLRRDHDRLTVLSGCERRVGDRHLFLD